MFRYIPLIIATIACCFFPRFSIAFDYTLKTPLTLLENSLIKSSGITQNPNNRHYITIYSGQKYLVEYDENFNYVRKIYNGSNGSKLEDISFLRTNTSGDNEYAIVIEQGVLHIGVLPQLVDGFKLKNWQTINFANWGSSYGAEGIAYNPLTDTFFACKEGSPRKVLQFQRPTGDVLSPESLGAFEPFDAEQALNGIINRISSCRYNTQTNQLELLSNNEAKIVSVDLSGNLISSVELIANSEYKGFTFNHLLELVTLSSTSEYQVYSYSDDTPLPDTQAPSAPQNLAANIEQLTVTLNWQASTDDVLMSHYLLYRNGIIISQITHDNSQTIVSYLDTTVVQGEQYSYQVSAVDEATNESDLSPINGVLVDIPNYIDVEPPTAPTGLTAIYQNSAVQLNWQPAQDNIAVTSYKIYRDDVALAEVIYSENANFIDEQVVIGDSYKYQIYAIDAAGNTSALVPIEGVEITIAIPPVDQEPPTAPTQVNVIFTGQVVEVSWLASSDNISVSHYQVMRDSQVIATVSELAFTDNTIEFEQLYQYQIVAFDAENNSQASDVVAVSTAPDNNSKVTSPYPINQYVKAAQVASLYDTPAVNLSGITFNSEKQQYIALYNGNAVSNLFDTNFNFIKAFNNGGNGNDHEDVMFLGVAENGEHEYVVVDEYGRMHLGTNAANSDLNYKNYQLITYGAAAGNAGGEGVAYNRITDTFYVCIEGRNHRDPAKEIPMKILQFQRPATTDDVSYLDGSLTVNEPFNAEEKLNSIIGDISSCYFNNDTQHLLIMSEQSEKIIEVDLAGNLLFELKIDETIVDDRLPPHGSQFEGFAFNEDFSQLVLVSEGHYYVTYQANNVVAKESIVDVNITEPSNVARTEEVVTTGIPLPQGLVKDENILSFFEGDQEIPSQFTPLSHWGDGSIRWLLSEAKVSLNANEQKSLSLKVVDSNNEGNSNNIVNSISIIESANTLTVNTGELVVNIPTNYGGIIDKAWLNGKLLIDSPSQVLDRGAYISTDNTMFYSSLLTNSTVAKANDQISHYLTNSSDVDADFSLNRNNPFDLNVEVEQTGDLHSIVKISGTHLNNAGESFSSFIIRLHFYAGKNEIKVDHTLVYTGDNTQPITGYGLKLPFVGNSTIIDGEETQTGQLLQSNYRQYQVNNATYEGQAKGYISRTNNNGSLSVVLRDMAERAPKALVAADNAIDIQLYPSSVSPWQLTKYSPEPAESDFTNYPLNQIATKQGETTRMTDHLYLRGAQGLSVTDNYHLAFTATSPTLETLNNTAKAIDHGPLLLLADSDWYSDSLVMGIGKFSFKTDLVQSEGHFRIDRFLQTNADFMRMNQRQQFDWFGIENYGDIRGRFFGSKTELYWHKRGRYGWSGNSGEPSNQLWTQFLRQPNQQLFLDAEALARHTADQQMVHFASATQNDKSTLDGRNLIQSVGSLHRHGVQAWSGYANSADYSHIAGVETYYYLTGDQRAKDTLYESGAFILRQRDNKTAIKNGIDVLDRVAAVFYDDLVFSAAIETKLMEYNNYLITENNGWNIVEARLIDFNNNGQHDRDQDGKTNRQLYQTAFEFFIRAAPGLLYRYERTKDPVVGQLIMDAANILVAGDGDDWDLTSDGHAGSYLYHMNLLAFAAQYAEQLGYESAPYYALAKRAVENNTRGGSDTNDTAPVSLTSVQAIPNDWQEWNWLWQEEINPSQPGILWLSRILNYQNNTLQDYHSYRSFIHLATCAAIVPLGEMELR